MAISDKNIVITPNVSGTLGSQPKIVFTGADSSIGDSSAITLTARPENTGTLSFTGTAGQLFSITNSLEGTIFSVNDVSGIPSLEIGSDGIIKQMSEGRLQVDVKMPEISMPPIQVNVVVNDAKLKEVIKAVVHKTVGRAG